MRRAGACFAVIFVIVFALFAAACARPGTPAPVAGTPPTAAARLEAAYGRLPLHFEENRGQFERDVRFVARTSTDRIQLAPGRVVLSLDGAPVHLSFAGGTSAAVVPQALEALPGRVNYYRGSDPKNWYTDIPTFARVRYAEVYPGVDVIVYGNQRQLEYDFVVAPGADPRAIRVRVDGADAIELDAGNLKIRRGDRTIVQHAPVVYQERDGRREPVTARYVLRRDHEVAFDIGGYDRSRPLVIDPIIVYSARIGHGAARGIAVDSAGYAYFAGENAGGYPYPMVNAAYPQPSSNWPEIFVTKLSPNGDSLIYSTYIGGFDRDELHGIATDGAGNAYITGTTHADYPTTPGAFQSTTRVGQDGSVSFVTKFGPTGAIVYSTFLNGTTFDDPMGGLPGGACMQGSGNGIAADAAGHAYVVGSTSTNNFPTTPGAYIPTKPTVGSRCLDYPAGYLTKLSPDGASLVYSTYLDGNGRGLSVAVDAAGSAFVGGIASAPSAPPGTLTASVAASGVGTGYYIAKFNANGFPTQTTTIGALPQSIAVGSDGSVYIAGGFTPDFNTVNAFQPASAGSTEPVVEGREDGFAARLNASGTAWLWATYIGGTARDEMMAIAAASDGSAWVAGYTSSSDFPVKDALRTKTQPVEAVALKIAGTGGLLFSSALGDGLALGVAVAGAGVYLTGTAAIEFLPTSPGAYSSPPTSGCSLEAQANSYSGGCDVFVLKLSEGGGDTTKPTVAITKPSNGAWTGNSINIAATASDDVKLTDIKLWGNGKVFGTIPCSGTTCTGDVWWSTGALPPAAYEVNAVATDKAGNQTVSATITIFKDAKSPVVKSGATTTGGGGTTPPALTATITSPSNGATVSGDVTVTFGSSNASGTPMYTLKVDNSNVIFSGTTSASSVSTPWSTAGYSNGTHTLNLSVTDGAGRTATSAVSVTVSNAPPGGGGGGDTTKPTVSITSPANGVWTGNSIGVSASASDNVALTNIKLWGNGAVFATIPCSGATCSGSVTWTTGPLPPGAYEVNAVATDTAGNQTVSATVTIFKDAKTPVVASGATATGGGGGGGTTTPLTASITSPANGATVAGNVTVNMAAGGASGTPSFTLAVDNGPVLFSGSGTSTASTTWSTTGYANGTHTLNLTVTDGAGRTATSAVTVTVANPTGGGGADTTPPSVAITSPANGAWTGNSIRVAASATDNVQVATLKFYGNGTQFGQLTCGTATCSGEQWWTTGALPSGKHTITVVATDSAGNQTTSAPVVINK